MKIKSLVPLLLTAVTFEFIGYHYANKPVYSDLMQAIEEQNCVVTFVNSEGEAFEYESEFKFYLSEYYNVTFRDTGKQGQIIDVTYEAIDLF